MANPREIALKILLDVENDRAYSNLELNHTLVQEQLSGDGMCSEHKEHTGPRPVFRY